MPCVSAVASHFSAPVRLGPRTSVHTATYPGARPRSNGSPHRPVSSRRRLDRYYRRCPRAGANPSASLAPQIFRAHGAARATDSQRYARPGNVVEREFKGAGVHLAQDVAVTGVYRTTGAVQASPSRASPRASAGARSSLSKPNARAPCSTATVSCLRNEGGGVKVSTCCPFCVSWPCGGGAGSITSGRLSSLLSRDKLS